MLTSNFSFVFPVSLQPDGLKHFLFAYLINSQLFEVNYRVKWVFVHYTIAVCHAPWTI